LAAIKRQGYCITDVGPHSLGRSTSAQARELEPISTYESKAQEEGHDLVNGGKRARARCTLWRARL
jgi:hypothetical protein